MEIKSSDYAPVTSIFVSVELSKRNWLVASLTPDATKASLRTIPAGDSPALLNHLRNLERKASERIGAPAIVRLCFEIGYDGFWLARLLRANDVDTYVLDPASFLVSRRGKRVKTDRIDAEAMIGILKAYLAGDRSVCRVVDVPTPEEEDARRIMRERSDAGRRGVLSEIRKSTTCRFVSGLGASPVFERRCVPRSGHQQGRQPRHPCADGRTRLVLAAISTRQRDDALVSRAVQGQRQPRSEGRDRRAGP